MVRRLVVGKDHAHAFFQEETAENLFVLGLPASAGETCSKLAEYDKRQPDGLRVFENRHRLEEALAKIDISIRVEGDLTALALVTNLGFSPAEIGAALGVSPGAAKVIRAPGAGQAAHRSVDGAHGATGRRRLPRVRGALRHRRRHEGSAARPPLPSVPALASGDVELFAVPPPAGGAT